MNADLALLRFALQHSDSPDLSNSPAPKPEDIEWLKKVMADMETDAQKMKKILSILSDEKTITLDRKLASLEELQYFVEDIDNSIDFVKMGGNQYLKTWYKDDDDQIRKWAMWITSSCCLNNISIQKIFLEEGILDDICSVLDNEKSNAVKDKALSSISAIIKNYNEAQEHFIEKEGLKYMAQFLQHPSPSARMKSAFFPGSTDTI
eukprot:TRINITY_DN5402_c0_g1_i3.p1 TRINITY_DN5402_c0_g1~~TRINITY_DN5402_c0_g1_i3.p1  ORF type:complete len:235 (-),score=57.64 TRINITY_DN5402_c0_g1_i3:282-899(-)